MIAQLLRFIVTAPRVDAEVLAAGVATYFVIGIVWAMLYLFIGFMAPKAFQLSAGKALDGFNALYGAPTEGDKEERKGFYQLVANDHLKIEVVPGEGNVGGSLWSLWRNKDDVVPRVCERAVFGSAQRPAA